MQIVNAEVCSAGGDQLSTNGSLFLLQIMGFESDGGNA